MVAFKGRFDGKVIVPEEPVSLRAGQRLIVTAQPIVAAKDERGESSLEWLARNAVSDPSLPTDLSYQHDHYLYGTPKKPPVTP